MRRIKGSQVSPGEMEWGGGGAGWGRVTSIRKQLITFIIIFIETNDERFAKNSNIRRDTFAES